MKPSRMTLNTAVVLALSVAPLLAGCGGSDATGPDGGDGSSLTATIDGSSWRSTAGAESFGVPITLPGLYSITGSDTGTGLTMAISLYNIGAPGTYPMGVGATVAGGSAIVSNASGGWATPQSGAAGTLTITTLTDARIAGTFSFTAEALTGSATGTRTVADGRFDLEVKPTGTVAALPEYAGAKVTATLGGAAFTAAAVAGQLTGGASILAVSGSNTTRLVTFSLTGVTGPGSYTLDPGTTAGTLGVSGVASPLTSTWSSKGAGASATVTLTSITSTRIKGTFSGTLGPAPGTSTTGSLSVVNGVFDIGRPPGS